MSSSGPARLDERALEEWGERLRDATRVIIGCDFDGTLAPVAPRPEEPRIDPEIRISLERLSRLDRVIIAVISGRALDDLEARVGIPDLVYGGNHGFELRGPGWGFSCPVPELALEHLASTTRRLTERLAHIPGLIIEPKGITASIHVRNVEPPLHPRVEDEILREIEENDDLLVVATGRMILEIKPRVNWGKGKALSHIVGRLVREDSTPPLVSFIGDDRTDEDAFIAFPDGLSVRIRSGRETPRRTAARYEVESQDRVPAYFQWLLEALTHRADDSKRSLTQQ